MSEEFDVTVDGVTYRAQGYAKNKDNMVLSSGTRVWVESELRYRDD